MNIIRSRITKIDRGLWKILW